MSRFAPPIWVTRRFLYALGGLAALVALGSLSAFVLALAWVFAALLLATLAIDAVFGPSSDAVAATRVPPGHYALRSAATLEYQIDNHSDRPIRVGIIERPIRTLAFDRDEIEGVAPSRSATILKRPVVPIARGSADLGDIFLWYENSLGLLRRRVQIAAGEQVRVYPDLSAVERYGKLHARNRLIEAGLRKMKLRGIGNEFESLREYASGDGFRQIDWKSTAKRGKLMVVQHEIERSQNIMLVLDCGRLMTARLNDQRKFDYAITAALSVATIAGLANDKVGVVAFARRILLAIAPRNTKQLATNLYDLEPRFEESDYSAAFGFVRAHLHKRSLVLFFTDMFDPVAQTQILAEIGSVAKRNVVVCIFMNDAAIDEALRAEPRTAQDVYRSSVAAVLSEERRSAAAVLRARGIHVIDVPAARLTTALIDEYLRIKARGLL
ncbi:MAG: DUF58 domain-containing protein [Candidatus Eremiobacteraeota bacterium]|nr:DUF58 domain-containing protein [Candidatus Eremiobacteraeota bacterium]